MKILEIILLLFSLWVVNSSGTTAKMALLNKRNYIGFEVNEDYYQGSLKRLEKFKDVSKNITNEISVDDVTCVVNDKTTDKELEEKTKLFNKLVDELNVYFNEQSLSVLKNLTISIKPR